MCRIERQPVAIAAVVVAVFVAVVVTAVVVTAVVVTTVVVTAVVVIDIGVSVLHSFETDIEGWLGMTNRRCWP